VVLDSIRQAQLHDEISKILKSRRRAPLRARRASTQEITVADDKSKTGNPDRQRINTSQEHELRDWAKKFGVSEDMLRTAVTQVGNQAKDVERYLKDKAKR
jgi:hypothetical protein